MLSVIAAVTDRVGMLCNGMLGFKIENENSKILPRNVELETSKREDNIFMLKFPASRCQEYAFASLIIIPLS